MSYTQEMKSSDSFWQSLEKYTWKTVSRSPLSWPQVVVPMIVLILLLSITSAKNSLSNARSTAEAIRAATERGDYQTAKSLYEKMTGTGKDPVLGLSSELEELVYPERRVEQRISELSLKLEEYPGNREIYLTLAELYSQIGNQEIAQEYREKARILDPNN